MAHPLKGASKRHGKSKRVAHTGGWGKKAKRSAAAKKAARTRARNKAKRSAAAKKGARKRKGGKKTAMRKKSGRKNRPRKKGAKRRGTTTTVKVGRVKGRLKCPPGKAVRGSFAKVVRGGKTWTAMHARCVSL